MKRIWIFLLSVMLPVASLFAESDTDEVSDTPENDFGAWVSIGAEKKLLKGLEIGVDAEYRLSDNLKRTDRWSVGASVSYRVFRNSSKTFDVKADAGVKYMNCYYPEKREDKDNDHGFIEYNSRPSYSVPKIRATASVSVSYKVARFKFSLRERYQFTGNDSVCVTETKWRYDKKVGYLTPRDTEDHWKAVDNRKHIMRSRLQVSYDIPKCPIEPYASAEMFNSLTNGFSIEKTRYTFGLECEFAKRHSVELYYAYQNHSDEDEAGGHVLGLGYKFKF